MPFFEYDQMNSGGKVIYDEKAGISELVIIEAKSIEEAYERALSIGLYFNGVDEGIDCDCCGNRWRDPFDDEGSLVPSSCSNPIEESDFGVRYKDKFGGFVHYRDGSMKGFNIF